MKEEDELFNYFHGQLIQKLAPEMQPAIINTYVPNEHVGEIECRIWVINERSHCKINSVPFKHIPKLMIVELIHFVMMWMNNFIWKKGISQKYGPTEIVAC